MNDQEKIQALLKIKDQPDIKVDIPGLKLPLEPHQRVAVAFMVLGEKTIDGDFLGAGKTVSAAATDLKLRSMGKVMRTLVVCQGGKRWDWQTEYQRFTDIPTYLIDGSKSSRTNSWLEAQAGFGVTIAHYQSIRGDFLNAERVDSGRVKNGKRQFHTVYSPAPILKMLKYDLVIFDEVTVFKGWDTALIQALWALIGQINPEYSIGLSATPIQKQLEDLHSIMSVVRPGYLGTRDDFEKEYCIKQLFSTYVGKGNRKVSFLKTVGTKNEEKLRQLMAPVFIRREKEQVYAGRIKHVPKVRRVLLGSAQTKAYSELQSKVDRGDSRGALLQVFLEMEKVCDTMTWYPGGVESSKIDDIRSLLNGDLAEEKVVVFSKYKQPLRHLAQFLQEDDIGHVAYTGDVPMQQREQLRHQFQEDSETRIALVTTAAEMGFDFHAAHYMIFINHIYNPARMDQLRGRIDRPIVQKSNFICTIHYLCEGTFEENVIPRLHKEADLMKKVFGAENSFDPLKTELIDALSNDQLFDLIKTGRLRADQEQFV